VEVLENNGEGLNLTSEVRDGILKHSKGYGKIIPDDPNELAATIEGRVVRVADIMAYLNHDLDDAIRSGVIHEDQVPQSCVRVLGQTHSERARTMIRDLVFSSKPHKGELRLNISDKVSSGMTELRKFLYDNVYRSPKVHNEFMKAKVILTELYRYFLNDAAMLEKGLKEMGIESHRFPNVSKDRIVCDFIASMTDRYALNLYTKIFFPSPLV
jgi:dGTPase